MALLPQSISEGYTICDSLNSYVDELPSLCNNVMAYLQANPDYAKFSESVQYGIEVNRKLLDLFRVLCEEVVPALSTLRAETIKFLSTQESLNANGK